MKKRFVVQSPDSIMTLANGFQEPIEVKINPFNVSNELYFPELDRNNTVPRSSPLAYDERVIRNYLQGLTTDQARRRFVSVVKKYCFRDYNSSRKILRIISEFGIEVNWTYNEFVTSALYFLNSNQKKKSNESIVNLQQFIRDISDFRREHQLNPTSFEISLPEQYLLNLDALYTELFKGLVEQKYSLAQAFDVIFAVEKIFGFTNKEVFTTAVCKIIFMFSDIISINVNQFREKVSKNRLSLKAIQKYLVAKRGGTSQARPFILELYPEFLGKLLTNNQNVQSAKNERRYYLCGLGVTRNKLGYKLRLKRILSVGDKYVLDPSIRNEVIKGINVTLNNISLLAKVKLKSQGYSCVDKLKYLGYLLELYQIRKDELSGKYIETFILQNIVWMLRKKLDDRGVSAFAFLLDYFDFDNRGLQKRVDELLVHIYVNIKRNREKSVEYVVHNLEAILQQRKNNYSYIVNVKKVQAQALETSIKKMRENFAPPVIIAKYERELAKITMNSSPMIHPFPLKDFDGVMRVLAEGTLESKEYLYQRFLEALRDEKIELASEIIEEFESCGFEIFKRLAKEDFSGLSLNREHIFKMYSYLFLGKQKKVEPGIVLNSPREQFLFLAQHATGHPKIKIIEKAIRINGENKVYKIAEVEFEAEVFTHEKINIIASGVPRELWIKEGRQILSVYTPGTNTARISLFHKAKRLLERALLEEVHHARSENKSSEFFVKLLREGSLGSNNKELVAEKCLEEVLVSHAHQPQEIRKAIQTAIELVPDLKLNSVVRNAINKLHELDYQGIYKFDEASFIRAILEGKKKTSSGIRGHENALYERCFISNPSLINYWGIYFAHFKYSAQLIDSKRKKTSKKIKLGENLPIARIVNASLGELRELIENSKNKTKLISLIQRFCLVRPEKTTDIIGIMLEYNPNLSWSYPDFIESVVSSYTYATKELKKTKGGFNLGVFLQQIAEIRKKFDINSIQNIEMPRTRQDVFANLFLNVWLAHVNLMDSHEEASLLVQNALKILCLENNEEFINAILFKVLFHCGEKCTTDKWIELKTSFLKFGTNAAEVIDNHFGGKLGPGRKSFVMRLGLDKKNPNSDEIKRDVVSMVEGPGPATFEPRKAFVHFSMLANREERNNYLRKMMQRILKDPQLQNYAYHEIYWTISTQIETINDSLIFNRTLHGSFLENLLLNIKGSNKSAPELREILTRLKKENNSKSLLPIFRVLTSEMTNKDLKLFREVIRRFSISKTEFWLEVENYCAEIKAYTPDSRIHLEKIAQNLKLLAKKNPFYRLSKTENDISQICILERAIYKLRKKEGIVNNKKIRKGMAEEYTPDPEIYEDEEMYLRDKVEKLTRERNEKVSKIMQKLKVVEVDKDELLEIARQKSKYSEKLGNGLYIEERDLIYISKNLSEEEKISEISHELRHRWGKFTSRQNKKELSERVEIARKVEIRACYQQEIVRSRLGLTGKKYETLKEKQLLYQTIENNIRKKTNDNYFEDAVKNGYAFDEVSQFYEKIIELIKNDGYCKLDSSGRYELVVRHLNKDTIVWFLENFTRLGINELDERKKLILKIIELDAGIAANYLKYFRVINPDEAEFYLQAFKMRNIDFSFLDPKINNRPMTINSDRFTVKKSFQIIDTKMIEPGVYVKGDIGPTIVFLHPLGATSVIYEEVFKRSVLKSFRLIALDMPGSGALYNQTLIDYSYDEYANWLKKRLESLGINSPLLVGNSYGGHVITHAADKILDAKGFVLIGCTPNSGFVGPFLPTKKQTGFDVRNFSKFQDTSFLTYLRNVLREVNPHVINDIMNSIWSGDFRDECQLIRDALQRGVSFNCLIGEHDKIADIVKIRNLGLPTSFQLSRKGNGGHFLQLDCPYIVSGEIARIARSIFQI